MTLRYTHIHNATDAPRTMVRLWEGPFPSFGVSLLFNKWSKAKIELTKLGNILKYMFEKLMILAFSKKEYNIIMRYFPIFSVLTIIFIDLFLIFPKSFALLSYVFWWGEDMRSKRSASCSRVTGWRQLGGREKSENIICYELSWLHIHHFISMLRHHIVNLYRSLKSLRKLLILLI